MKSYYASLLALFLLAGTAGAQKINWKKLDALQPDSVLRTGERPPTKVLLLGTFHFNYPNLDGHKTDSSKFIDVLSPVRQRELEELAGVIARFRPTRIYIESSRQAYHDSLFAAYRAGRYTLGRNEIYQVGYRVARQHNLPGVYAVDAGNLMMDYRKSIRKIDSLWNYNVPVDTLRDRYWGARYKAYYTAGDSVQATLTLLENFLVMAQPAVLRRMHGAYLTSGFNTQGTDGPDLLSIWWYNRNLRIFNRILQTKPTGEDRILVLFGNGHMPILKHCFESSPEFEVVELRALTHPRPFPKGRE
ncbi:DUF5694 domain-containing protein [Flaviaesturariibacter amylovorans]|uniref:TraB/GumN family protein n=1 Tax=Flaviaesturariibacter amylovorans TaxID=1084520 RepID=A0ABP8HGD7_9BACT